MRDIVNAPVFLRLGARMRSPQGTPVGTMKRILISHVNVFNADSRYSSIISGIPGALIENVTLSDIHIYHQGGYTEADGLLTPPEQEKYILNHGCSVLSQQKDSTFHMLRIFRFIISISIMRNRMDVLYS